MQYISVQSEIELQATSLWRVRLRLSKIIVLQFKCHPVPPSQVAPEHPTCTIVVVNIINKYDLMLAALYAVNKDDTLHTWQNQKCSLR